MFRVWCVGWSVLFLKRGNERDVGQDIDTASNGGLLCRFVLDGQGKKIGESIALSHDLLIIKSGKDFLGIPVKHIEDEGHLLLVKGLLDQSKALELGIEWQKVAYKEIVYPLEEK